MNTISVVVITFNEERNIERCLQSVQPVADEIIVVDSFSTDLTEEICKRYGVRFFQNKWPGYGKQKNFANELASCSFILSIDADEVLSDTLAESIVRIKTAGHAADAYKFNRLTNYCGRKWIRHCGWYPDAKVRLWRNGKAHWDYAEVHESLIVEADAATEWIKGDLLHYTYQSIADHMKIADKYTTLLAHKYDAQNKKTNILSLVTKSSFCFIRDYFFRRGILDGYYGFVICAIASFSTFLKYAKLRELQKDRQ